jgi:putative flippase GtrA
MSGIGIVNGCYSSLVSKQESRFRRIARRFSPMQRRFFIFLLTGGASTVVNIVLRYLLSRMMFFEAAVAVAYIFSTAIAFMLARTFVFGGSLPWLTQLGRFVAVNVLGLVQVLGFSALLVRVLFPVIAFRWHPEETAHVLALASLAFTSFHAHRMYSFRDAGPQPDEIREKDA